MGKTQNTLSLQLLLLIVSSIHCQEVPKIQIFEKFEELNLTAHSVSWIYTYPKKEDRFLLFESHTVSGNIILSKELPLVVNNYVNSTDPALLHIVEQLNQTKIGVYLINPHHFSVRVLSRVVGYSEDDPVPGQCSNKAGVWPLPGLTLETKSEVVRLNFSFAAPNIRGACNNRKEVSYKVFQGYICDEKDMEHALFEALKNFKDLESIETWGSRVSSLGPHQNRLVFASYAPRGSVYAVIAEAVNGSSLYGLGHSYGCHVDPVTGACPQETLAIVQIFSACSLFAGLLLAFMGHRYFLSSQIIFGFYAGVYLGYILLQVFCDLELYLLFFLVMACGVGLAIATVSIWIFLGIPVLSVVLPTLEVGVVLASVILYLPETNTITLTSSLHYWLVFTCLVLAGPISLLAFTHKANILACVIVGSVLAMIPVDFFLGTGLRFIFLNVLRRSYVEDYSEAIFVPLLQSEELLLLASLLATIALALLTQLLVQRRRPPFPPSPFQQWRWRQEADAETEPLLSSEQGLEETQVRPAVVGFIQTRPERKLNTRDPPTNVI